DIEVELQIRRSSVTSMLHNLEKLKMIQRVSVDQDARLKKIVLTHLGKEVTQNTYHHIITFEDELSSLFTDDEYQQLYHSLTRLENYLKEKEGNHND
ncbi:MAG TPA: hypothetical protein O0X78_02845, partial [Methanocorpusculum sp.]|nr:hypothetical protein [Methanocorpusculum sp.]